MTRHARHRMPVSLTVSAAEAMRTLPWRWAVVYVCGPHRQIAQLCMTRVAAEIWVRTLDDDPREPTGWEVARIDIGQA